METKICKIGSVFLILNLLFIIFATIFFSSCSQKKEKDDVKVWATVYHIKIASFNTPGREIKVTVPINIFYVIKSNRLLTDNDILVEKTGNQLDTLKLVYADSKRYDKAIPLLPYPDPDAIIMYLENNQSNHCYKCYSNKYLDVDYIWSSSQKNDLKKNDFKEYYRKTSNVIKNTDLIFNGDTLQKFDMHNEYFLVDYGRLNSVVEIWSCKDW